MTQTEHLSHRLHSAEVWHGVVSLRVGFSPEQPIDATAVGETIRIRVDGTILELSRTAATALRSALGEALTDEIAFLRTEGNHRADGSYEIARRTAESTGNATVFESFPGLEEAYQALPREFGAADIEQLGVSGSRRHMVVWHFIEHPAFCCELGSRNPLRATKTGVDRD